MSSRISQTQDCLPLLDCFTLSNNLLGFLSSIRSASIWGVQLVLTLVFIFGPCTGVFFYLLVPILHLHIWWLSPVTTHWWCFSLQTLYIYTVVSRQTVMQPQSGGTILQLVSGCTVWWWSMVVVAECVCDVGSCSYVRWWWCNGWWRYRAQIRQNILFIDLSS